MAAVASLPPVPIVRTNWGRPSWCTTTTVNPAPDRHDGFRFIRRVIAVGQGPDQGGGDEVHSFNVEVRLFHGGDDAIDQLPVGGGHENTAGDGSVFGRVVTQELGGEDRLIDRKRDDLLRLESHGTLDFVVGNPGEIELSGDDAESGDADDDGVRRRSGRCARDDGWHRPPPGCP